MKIEETMPDFRKSLLDADEHLDIKINRFGGSTTPAIMWKAFFFTLYLVAQYLEPKFQICAK